MRQLKKIFILSLFLVNTFSTCFPVAPPQPFNFTQNKNWCWMTAALQCFYRIESFREIVKKIVAQNIPPNDPMYEPWIFFSRLDAVFSQVEKNRCDLTSFYDFVFKKKHPEHEIIMQKKFLQNYLDKWEARKLEDALKNKVTVDLYMQKLALGLDPDELPETNHYSNLKQLIISGSYHELTSKYGEQGEPFKFIVFVYAALRAFLNLQPQEQLIRLISSDFEHSMPQNSSSIHELIARKTPRTIMIVHHDGILNEIMHVNNTTFELVGICMHLPGHYIALVKYEKQWIKLDSCGGLAGEKKGENLTQVLSNFGKQNTFPKQYFYQKKPEQALTKKITKLKKKLQVLSTKLKDLSQALTNLRNTLSAKST
jgi:hypothetical protein